MSPLAYLLLSILFAPEIPVYLYFHILNTFINCVSDLQFHRPTLPPKHSLTPDHLHCPSYLFSYSQLAIYLLLHSKMQKKVSHSLSAPMWPPTHLNCLPIVFSYTRFDCTFSAALGSAKQSLILFSIHCSTFLSVTQSIFDRQTATEPFRAGVEVLSPFE